MEETHEEIQCELQEPVKKYKKYNDSALHLAIEEKKKNDVSFGFLSRKYQIPVTTIHDNYHNRLKRENGAKRGAKPVLFPEEEKKISEWIKNCAKMGDPRTIDDLRKTASEVRKARVDSTTALFKNDVPSQFWVTNFLKRNNDVAFRTPETITRAAANVTEARIKNFFENVYSYFKDNDVISILERPEAIINLDESGFELNPTLKRVLAEKGAKNVYSVESGRGKESITVNFAFTASGEVLRPQIIYKDSFTRMGDAAYMSSVVNGNFMICQSANGWQTKKTFDAYLKLLIDDLEVIPKPIVFFFDNHPSHINMELFKYCQERNVHVITFPPNTTHILQMADVGMFGPVKALWKKEMHEWRIKNHDQVMDEVKFIPLLKKVMDMSLSKQNILSGFKKTGIYPFDMTKVDYQKCLGSGENFENSSEKNATNTNDCQKSHKKIVYYQDDQMANEEDEIDKTILEMFEPERNIEKYPYIKNVSVDQNNEDGYPEYLMESETEHVDNIVIVDSDEENENIQDFDMKGESSLESINLYISKVKDYVLKSKEILEKKYPGRFELNTSMIMQQCEFIEYSLDKDNSHNSVSTPTVNEILKIPPKYKRKTNRQFKEKFSGPMTDKNILKHYVELHVIQELQDREKKERKAKREEKKALKEQELKKKKENIESSLKDQKNSVKRGRGRPKKKLINN